MFLYPALQFDPIAAILFLPFLFLYSMLSATVCCFVFILLVCVFHFGFDFAWCDL